jgi:hypothetical protein
MDCEKDEENKNCGYNIDEALSQKNQQLRWI